MKKSLVLSAIFTLISVFAIAQNYYEDDFVGKWDLSNSSMLLSSNKSAKVTFNNGTSEWGTWDYWSYGLIGDRLTISLKSQELRFRVISLNSSKLTLVNLDSEEYYYFNKGKIRSSSSSSSKKSEISGLEAGALILGGLFLMSLLDSDSGSSDSYYSPSEKNRRWMEQQREADYEMRRREAERRRRNW